MSANSKPCYDIVFYHHREPNDMYGILERLRAVCENLPARGTIDVSPVLEDNFDEMKHRLRSNLPTAIIFCDRSVDDEEKIEIAKLCESAKAHAIELIEDQADLSQEEGAGIPIQFGSRPPILMSQASESDFNDYQHNEGACLERLQKKIGLLIMSYHHRGGQGRGGQGRG